MMELLLKCKTVDELVNNCKLHVYQKGTEDSTVLLYIIKRAPNILVNILESPNNKQSKYDLTIISLINNDVFGGHNIDKILAAYKNRKV